MKIAEFVSLLKLENGMAKKWETVKRFDFKRPPRQAGRFLLASVRLIVANIWARGQKISVKLTGMEGIKPPYLLLMSHSSQMDFPVLYKVIKPYRINVVASHSGIRDAGEMWLTRLGCIFKRTGVQELTSLKHLKYCVDHYGDVVGIYPESHYSLDGTTDRLSETVARLGRFLKVPIVTLRTNGTYLAQPQWNDHVRHTMIDCEFTCVATKDEAMNLSAEETMARIRGGLERDELAWQRENGILIKDKKRANGLHRILYRCPHCNREYQTDSRGTLLWCNHCNKTWEMTELGELKAREGETEFSHIPDWVQWERQCLREEIESGNYRFEDEVGVHSLPHYKKFYDQGKGKLVHTAQGMVLDCTLYGKHQHLVWATKNLPQIHIEFNYPMHKRKRRDNRFGDCFELSVADDSYWLVPQTKHNCLMKLYLATEEIYAMTCVEKE